MLLRRITKHVTDQNWFAVFLDFLIVVVGILIAFQVTNWNDTKQAQEREQIILQQLGEEFEDIQAALERQISHRKSYINDIYNLVLILEGKKPADDLAIKTGLIRTRASGRLPVRSATYVQLTSNGELAKLSSQSLQKNLIDYDSRLERDAFIMPLITSLVIEELSTNNNVKFNIEQMSIHGADVDDKKKNNNIESIASYDLQGLKQAEKRYETLYITHSTLLTSEKKLLEVSKNIQQEIRKGLK